MQQADYKQTLVSLPVKTIMRTTVDMEDGLEEMHNAAVRAIQISKKIAVRLEGGKNSEDGS